MHLFECKNKRMRQVTRSSIFAIQNHCLQASIPSPIIDALISIFEHICGYSTLRNNWTSPAICRAVESQQQIGLHRMALGLFSIEWNYALAFYNVKEPQTEMEMIIDAVWEDLCDPVWRERNSINNDTGSFTHINEAKTLREKLQWYYDHQDEAFDYRHRFLVSYNRTTLQKLTRNTMRELVSQLDAAHKYHTTELSQLSKNQMTIISWIESTQSIAQRVKTNRRMNLDDTTQSMSSDSTQEFEFEWDPQQDSSANRDSNHSDPTMDWDPHQSSRIRNDNFDHDIKWRDSGSPNSDSKITA